MKWRVASIGFPIVIALLIPLRTFIVPMLPFTDEELSILDGPTASPFVSRCPTFCFFCYKLMVRLPDYGIRRWSWQHEMKSG